MSNELGAGNAKVAKRSVRVVLSIAILESTLVGSVMILIRKIWGFAYSSDPKVVTYVASMMPILAIGHLLDSVQSVFSGYILHSKTFCTLKFFLFASKRQTPAYNYKHHSCFGIWFRPVNIIFVMLIFLVYCKRGC